MREIRTETQLARSYDNIWAKSILYEEREYYSWIADLLDIKQGKCLLDVACGAGYMLSEAHSRGAETHGIDISRVAVRLAQKESPESHIEVGGGEALPFADNLFDYVTCLGSLEHYLNVEKGVREIGRVLKGDGLTCIVLPNKWYWYDCWAGMRYGCDPSHGQELERFYSKRDASSLLEGNGLKVAEIHGYNKRMILRRRWKPFEFFYGRWLRHMVPLNASYVFAFICRKFTDITKE